MRRYSFGLLLIPVAAGLTLLLSTFGLPHTPAAFLAAVLIAAWFGGAGPGLLTLTLSALAFNTFFLHTPPQLALSASALPFLGNFVLFGLLVVWFSSARQRAELALQRARDELEARVVERTGELQLVNRELRAEVEERSRAEERLSRSESYLTEAQLLSHIGSWALSPASGEYLQWSRELYRIYGFDPVQGTVSFAASRERIHPADRTAFDAAVKKALADQVDFRLQHRLVLPDGSTKYVQTLGHPVLDPSGQLVEFVGVVMDVTRRRRADRALRRARERALAARFAAVLEERTRLAREIHDTLIQGFTGISLKLLAVSNRLSGPTDAVQGVRDVLTLAQRTLEDARRAIWDIRPAALGQEDLQSAVAGAARAIISGTPITLDWLVEGTPYPVDPVAEAIILRVAQEAVANVVKHAAASRVYLSLSYQPRSVELSVKDDGRGFPFDPHFQADTGHWGLLGMQERAAQARGRLGIRSSVGQGTEVVLTVPARPPRPTSGVTLIPATGSRAVSLNPSPASGDLNGDSGEDQPGGKKPQNSPISPRPHEAGATGEISQAFHDPEGAEGREQ
jgi:PAS domain S-box-containing protein